MQRILFLARHALVCAALGSCVACAASGAHRQDTRADSGNVQEIQITAKKYEFVPSEIRVKAGARVRIRVHSLDTTHGIKLNLYPEGTKQTGKPGLEFADPEQNGKTEKGEDQILEFVAVAPGTYEFKCAKVCGMHHGRMKGQIIVEP